MREMKRSTDGRNVRRYSNVESSYILLHKREYSTAIETKHGLDESMEAVTFDNGVKSEEIVSSWGHLHVNV